MSAGRARWRTATSKHDAWVSSAAEKEVVAGLLAAAMRGADEHVARDAAQVVDHPAVDEARQSAVVRADVRPRRGMIGRHLAVVDGGAARVLVDDEVARPGEPRERLVIVSPELVAPPRGPTEALLEERE